MNRDQYLQKKNWLRAKFDIDDVMLGRDERSVEDRHPQAPGGQANAEACLPGEACRPRLAAKGSRGEARPDD